MRIAVDFDGTLEFENIQNKVKKLIEDGHHVEIVTTRWDEEHKQNYPIFAILTKEKQDNIHSDLYEVAKKLNLKINFTNMEYKAKFINENGFNMLIDDNWREEQGLNKNVKFELV